MHDIDRARSALHALDPGCARDTWVRIGMAAHAAGLDVEDFDHWSAGAANYGGARDVRSVWHSFRPGGGISAATLFSMARDAGWSDPINGHARPRKGAQKRAKPLPRAERPPFDWNAVWCAAEPAAHEHPYIMRKLGLTDGLRIYCGPLQVAGQALDGALLVPVHGADGTMQSWQAILPDGVKRSAPGATLRGGRFIVGGPVRGDRQIFVAEGIGQAWSAHQATRAPAVCCFGAGNVQPVAEDLHARHPKARIVIVADAGKESDAERIARAVGGAWVAMPEGAVANTDCNDVHVRNGLQAVAELLAQAQEPAAAKASAEEPRVGLADEPLRFHFLTVDELLRTPTTSWRVLRVIPARGLIVIWGASGSGKTFVALDMACAIARGQAWAGRRTKRGAVAYVAAEGHLRDRVDAYLRHNGLHSSELADLRVLDSAVNLLDPTADIQALIESLRVLALETGGLAAVIIDTLNRVMPGGDENSSEDMGMLIAAAKLIERDLACTVGYIHHSGKDESKGSRGHSSLKAATDAEISVKRDGDVRTVTAEKVRDGEDGEVLMTFRLLPVDLGAMSETDADADADERRTSCVVDSVEAGAPTQRVRMSDTDDLALRVLRELLRDTEDRTEATSLHPAGLACIRVDTWRERFRQQRGVDKNDPKEMAASKKAFQRAIDKLVRLRIVGVHGPRAWLW